MLFYQWNRKHLNHSESFTPSLSCLSFNFILYLCSSCSHLFSFDDVFWGMFVQKPRATSMWPKGLISDNTLCYHLTAVINLQCLSQLSFDHPADLPSLFWRGALLVRVQASIIQQSPQTVHPKSKNQVVIWQVRQYKQKVSCVLIQPIRCSLTLFDLLTL